MHISEKVKGRAAVPGQPAIAVLSCSGALSGSFYVSDGVHTPVQIGYNDSASSVAGAIGYMTGGSFTVTDGTSLPDSVTITADSNFDLSSLSISSDQTDNQSASCSLSQAGVADVSARNEVQTLTLSVTTAGAGGFSIYFSGYQTGSMAWDISAYDLSQSITGMVCLSNPGASVTATAVSGGFDLEFGDSLAGTDVAMLQYADHTVNMASYVLKSAVVSAAYVLVGHDNYTGGDAGTFNEATRNTDPGESNVWTGTSYKIANVSKTGTKVASSIPNCTAENVKLAVTIGDVVGEYTAEGGSSIIVLPI